MMEKNKPSGSESPVEEIVEEATTTDDREAEISRRLAALGDVILEEKEAESSDLCQEVLVDEEVETVKEEPIAVAPEKPKEEMKKPETPVSLPVPPAQTISAKANNKSALLVSTVLHCTVLILIDLTLVSSFRTVRLGQLFGVWFISNAALFAYHVLLIIYYRQGLWQPKREQSKHK